MIHTSLRAANELDLKATTGSRESLVRNLIVVSLPLSLILFGGVYVLSRSVWAASLVSAAVLVASAVSNIRFFGMIKKKQRLFADVSAVEVIEVESSRVLDIEPLGSHGPAICFFVDDGKALLLIGQWLLEQRSFPSTAFRLHHWSDTKRPIRIESMGREIVPEHSTVQLRANFRIGDIELFDAKPETLQRDLDRAFGEN